MEPSLANHMVFLLLFLATLRFGVTRSCTVSGAILSSSIICMWGIVASGTILGLCGALAEPYWGISATILVLSMLFIAPGSNGAKEVVEDRKVLTASNSILALLVVFLCLSLLRVTWISEPTNIDDFYYHYAKVLHLDRNHSFTPSGLEVVDGYPQNGEILSLFLATLLGTVGIADAVQILALPLYIASVSLLARSQNIERKTRVFIALLSCFVPAIWSLLITLHTDFLAAAFLLASVALILNSEEFDRRTSLLLLGASLGLGLGTKFVTLSWVMILCSWIILRRDRPRNLTEWVFLGMPLVVSGAGTYLLNVVRYQNPLYPYTISFLGFTLEGRYHSLGGLWEEQMTEGVPAIMKILNSWFSPAAMAQSNHEHWYGGLGTLWPFLFVVVVVAALSPAVRNRHFLGLMGLGVLLLVTTPANFTARFTLFLVPFGAIALGKVLDHLKSRGRDHVREALVSLAVLFSVHCAFQFFVLISTEFKNGIRAASLTGACKRAARPADLKVISTAHQKILEEADVIVVELGPAREERLWSFACLWALAPRRKLYFRDPSDQAVYAAEEPTGSTVILRTSSLPLSEEKELSPIYQGPQISLFSKKGS